MWLQPPFLLMLAVAMALSMQRSVTALAPTHLAAFLLTALVCHGELAKDRPSVSHLTEFYLWMSVGGVLGGIDLRLGPTQPVGGTPLNVVSREGA